MNERNKLQRHYVFGRPAMFCDVNCAESLREDRKHALIYPSYEIEGRIYGVEKASIIAGFCAYCGG